MTNEQIIRMAREADIEVAHMNKPMTDAEVKQAWLERFAALVAAHEREKFLNKLDGVSEKVIYETVKEAVLAERDACAKVCEEFGEWRDTSGVDCAVAIRARSN